jgi:hypothetical protein
MKNLFFRSKGANMHSIKRITILFFIFFIFSTSWLFSKLVTESEVEIVTVNWVKLENNLKHLRLNKIDVRISTIRELIYRNELIGYIVDLEPRGFILVPAFSELSPIKLISFSSNYEGIEKHPFIETLKYRLYFTAANLGYLGGYFQKTPDPGTSKVDTSQKEKNEGVWERLLSEDFLLKINLYTASVNSVSPMLTSRWSQGNPYNMYTPEIDSQHCVTGCSATAQAQVMYYWKYPTTGRGVNSYYWENGSTYLSADFSHPYYWSRMIDDYIGPETEEQKDAVARLMSDVGISINMNYGVDGSSAFPNANNSLVTFFKYCSDIRTVYRSDYLSWTDWFNVFKDQMDNGWPAILATYKPDEEGGHAVVIDGYRVEGDVNEVHVNMGWGGYADTYYTIDDIYNYGDADIDYAVINISLPDCTNTGNISGKVTDGIGNELENIHVKIYDQNSSHVNGAWTDSSGNYTADCLNEGNYRIFFDTSQTEYYFSEWYNDKDSFNTADSVPVTAESTTTGIDAVLEEGGGIKGKITNISGIGIKNVCVIVYLPSGGSYVAYKYTDSSGGYEIKGLKIGSYKIWFNTTYASGDYASEWYNDKDSFNTADLVSVTAGTTTTSIDAELPYTGPIVSGEVKNSVGTGIEGVIITFSNEGGTATTDSSGSYLHNVCDGWSGTATPSKTHYTFDPSSRSYSSLTSDQINQHYTASLVQYVLTISAGTGGTTYPLPGAHSYDAGTEVTITATADAGYRFSEWTGDVPSGHENDNPVTITMDADKSVTANFIRQYTLAISAETGGTTYPSSGTHSYDTGTEVTITANPNNGYEFSGWTGDVPSGHENDNPVTITMDADKSITASFRATTTDDGDGPGKKGGCFIATAAYGSLLHPYVGILRDFRDRYLMPGKLGRMLVNFYYKHSPLVADFIARNKALKVMVRISLLPLVAFSYSLLHFGPVITVVILVLIFALSTFFAWFYRRRMKA